MNFLIIWFAASIPLALLIGCAIDLPDEGENK